ncbi:MAG: response regulator [Rhodobacteraceae bacterium]|nr:response regulator [Paracoccaceae bacterium]
MVDPYHVLVVEDEAVTRMTLTSYFEAAGYRVSEAADGEAMHEALKHAAIDLILLDIKLPGEDGLSLLRKIRQSSDIAIIMVTSNGDPIDRVLGLELGAHDYVTKPFHSRELLARVKNLIRMTRAAGTTRTGDSKLFFDGWTLDRTARRLTDAEGTDVPLTRAEFDLLATLLANAGRAMSRDSLLDHVSHRDGEPYDRTIDVLVGRLRRKIEANSKDPRYLITVHGIGYLFAPASNAA